MSNIDIFLSTAYRLHHNTKMHTYCKGAQRVTDSEQFSVEYPRMKLFFILGKSNWTVFGVGYPVGTLTHTARARTSAS